MSAEDPNSEATMSPAARLRLAAKEHQDAFWAADTPASGVNFTLRQWQDVSNVHRLIHFNKNGCAGPLQPNMSIDSPPPCELATAEQATKEHALNIMEQLIKDGWAITVTIERALP